MNILVIGANGYVGSKLYSTLKSEGFKISGVDSLRRKDSNFTNDELIISNYSDLDSIFLDNFSDCIWLSGYSSVKQAEENPKEAFEYNLINLVDFREKFKGRFIYASSGSVYSRKTPEYCTETSQTSQPLNMYDYTKISFDNYLIANSLKGIGLRFGTVNGSGKNIKKELMINSMVHSALNEKKIYIKNSEHFRPILGIKDLIEGLKAVLNSHIDSGIYNMCSFNAKIIDIAEQVSRLLGVEIVNNGDSPTYNFLMDNRKFQKDFNFKFSAKIDDIVKDLVDYYEK